MNEQQIAQQWMDNCCETIRRYDHDAHMDLISRNVKVYGVPGFDVIGYDDWHSQCAYEFGEKLIQEASYQGLDIKQSDDQQIIFLTNETISASDGTVDTHPIEVVLTREADGKWRVTQERLLDNEEAQLIGLGNVLS